MTLEAVRERVHRLIETDWAAVAKEVVDDMPKGQVRVLEDISAIRRRQSQRSSDADASFSDGQFEWLL
jgi:hypothetical protein